METDDQRDVIDWLATPAAFGPGVTDVERIDTHAAIATATTIVPTATASVVQRTA